MQAEVQAMKGDFSRIRFEPNRHFTDVLEQQGRVAFDSDHNEQRFIDAHRRTLETIDVIGEYGAPVHEAGFEIGMSDAGLTIGPGRYYVHGLLCENLGELAYGEQPFLIEPDETDLRVLLRELLRAPDACLGVYLEVWQRMLTSLDDACLGEPALGQADTTVRLQTVWRVRAEPQVSSKPNVMRSGTALADVMRERAPLPAREPWKVFEAGACSCEAMYRTAPATRTGTLNARVAESGDACGCQPIPAAGYTGQENQLYRIEIQGSGTLDTATLKWSRENGSIVVAVLNVTGSKVSVASLGMDANLGFDEGQWVEIGDDTDLFGAPPDQPGRLYQIRSIDRSSMVLTMTTTLQPVDTSRNARMRRWDQTGDAATGTGIALSADWITIENGIQVRFGKGDYVAGDAWTIPARNATGQIEWPPCGSDGNPFQPPHYTRVFRAPLACIRSGSPPTKSGAGLGLVVEDCRRLFAPLTELGRGPGANALLIERINWRNDDVMTFDRLLEEGLQVTLNQPPTCPLSAANFIVTLEVPFPIPGREFTMSATTGESAASTTTAGAADSLDVSRDAPGRTILRTPLILDSLVALEANVLRWELPMLNRTDQLAELNYINQTVMQWARLGVPTRVRVRLPGHALYAVTDAGLQLYLDGQSFGHTVIDVTSKTSRIDLGLQSGDGQRASDFESWFYLYPVLAMESVSVTYSTLMVRDDGETASVVKTDVTPDVAHPVQRASIVLSYPAAQATAIQLALSGDAAVASVPATVMVQPGQSRVSVDISMDGAPAGAEASPFTLTASLSSAIGRATSATTSFKVYGERGIAGKVPQQAPLRNREAAAPPDKAIAQRVQSTDQAPGTEPAPAGETGADARAAPAPAEKPSATPRATPKRKRS
jgi:hypothetical protein